jgi:translation initiation factor 2A
MFGKSRRREVPGAEAAEGAAAVPGAAAADGDENLSKAALKNKKKREAKKAKDAAGKENGLGAGAQAPPVDPGRSPERAGRRGHERNRSLANTDLRQRSQNRSRNASRRRDLQPKGSSNGHAQPAAPQAAAAANGTATKLDTNGAAENAEAPDLTVTSPGGATGQDKKVRALTKKLRAIDDLKMRHAGGEKLEGTQIKKMETEESVRKELEALGWTE